MLDAILEAVAAPLAVIRAEPGGRLVIVAANEALAMALGETLPKLAGRAAEEVLPPALLQAMVAPASERPSAGLHDLSATVGPASRPYLARVRPLERSPGLAPDHVVTFVSVHAEADPLDGQVLEILDLQSEMVSRWRPDGTIDYCNMAFARQCGRSTAELIGANLFDLTPAAEVAQIVANLARLSPATPTSGYDHHLIGPDGAERWQEWIDRGSFDAQGRLVRILSVGRDITARKSAERKLAKSKQRLKLALEASRQVLWQAEILAGSRGLRIRIGTEGQAVEVDAALKDYHPDDRRQLRLALQALVEGATDIFRVEVRRGSPETGWTWVQQSARVAARHEHGLPVRLVGTMLDINARKEAEAHLRDSEQRLRLALEAGSFGVWESDLATERVHFDRTCLARHGWSNEPGELDLAEVRALIHPRDRARVRRAYNACRRGERAQVRLEYRVRRRDGSHAWIEEHAVVAERDQAGRPLRLVGVSTDISARKETETRLAHLALHDPLTGLPNRRALAEALDRAVARAERSGLALAVLALDLDGFKAVNDHHGHPAGDAALVEVGARLRRIVRRSDIVARLGGDEFAVIAGELKGPNPVVRLARRIRSVLAEPLTLPSGRARVGVSIGVAFYPGDGDRPDLLLSRSDRALYAAKRDGVGLRLCAELPEPTAAAS